MKKILALISCLALLAFNYSVVNSDRLVGFKIKHLGLWVDGTIGDFRGKLILDLNNLDYSVFDFSLGVNTLRTGMSKRDAGLMEEEWFDVSNHPRITFKSECLQKLDDNKYELTGILTIKGNSREEVIPFTFLQKNGYPYIKGEVNINRLDYNVGKSVMGMADTVNINFFLPIHSTYNKSIYTGR